MSRNEALILCIDDEPTVGSIIRLICERHGFKAIATTLGQDGIDLAMQILPDAILLDLMMPDLDGFEVCRRLKANPATKHIPIVFFSAKADEATVKRGLALGGAAYLAKPTKSPDIIQCIQDTLRSVRLGLNDDEQWSPDAIT